MPAFAGASFPPWPGTRNSSTFTIAKAIKWARYIFATFVPWGPHSPTYHYSYESLVSILRQWRDGTTIERIRYSLIQDLASGLSVKSRVHRLYSEYRSIHAKRWSPEEKLNLEVAYDTPEEPFIPQNLDGLLNTYESDSQQKLKIFVSNVTSLFSSLKIDAANPSEFKNRTIADLESITASLKNGKLKIQEAQESTNEIVSNSPITLNSQQNIVKNFVISKVHSGEQLLLILHGGPGTGKSTLINSILDDIPTGSTLCSATTGIAATLLREGKTIDSLLSLQSRMKNSTTLNDSKLSPLQQTFHGIKLIIIDETSMIDYTKLYKIHTRLQQITGNSSLLFGGISILLCGDFYQLPPVRSESWQTTILDTPKDFVDEKTRTREITKKIMESFLLADLTIQQRSIDQKHTENLNACRLGTKNCLQIVNDYGILSQQDLQNDFESATIIVASNYEKNVLNLSRAKIFAKKMGLPVIAWQKKPKSNMVISTTALSILYQQEVSLLHYFVEGAPALLLANQNLDLKIANGTQVTLHSLTLDQRTKAEDINLISQATPGSVVIINCPASVNVELTSSFHQQAKQVWPDQARIPNEEKLVIPLTNQDNYFTELKYDRHTTLQFEAFPFDLRFVLTFHKSQGQTLDKVILDIRSRPVQLGKMLFSGFYVGLSRVKSSSDIRLIRFNDSNTKRYLNKLSPDPKVAKWLQKYSPISPTSFIKKYHK